MRKPLYLVTGGAGFIGSHLVESLIARGERVRVIDDLSTGRRENVAPFEARIELHLASIADLAACRRAVEGADFVLHHAAIPSVPRSVDDPISTNAANVTGTLNMLVAARDAGVKRFVYAASSSAYGDQPALPKVETMPPSPQSPYAVQKYVGELYCRNFYLLYGLPTVSLRYFNIFGPRQDPDSPYSAAIPRFLAALLSGRRPTVYGNGEQTRDFTYVQNAVNANLLACRAPREALGAVINVASGDRFSLNRVVAELAAILGRPAESDHEAPRPGDVRDSRADISRARELLGYTVEVDFAAGLARTADWFRRG